MAASAVPVVEQGKGGRPQPGLRLGVGEVSRHCPPMRAKMRLVAGDQGDKDKGRTGPKQM